VPRLSLIRTTSSITKQCEALIRSKIFSLPDAEYQPLALKTKFDITKQFESSKTRLQSQLIHIGKPAVLKGNASREKIQRALPSIQLSRSHELKFLILRSCGWVLIPASGWRRHIRLHAIRNRSLAQPSCSISFHGCLHNRFVLDLNLLLPLRLQPVYCRS